MLRVMTLNIWNVLGDWRARRKDIVAWIDHLEPHVVCLQEVIESPDGKNQADWIAEQADGDWYVAFAGRDVMDGAAKFGNAVMSRWPIDEQHDGDLTSNPPGRLDEVQRLILHARTNDFDIFSTHRVWRYDEGHIREREVVEIDDFVRAHATPTVRCRPCCAATSTPSPTRPRSASSPGPRRSRGAARTTRTRGVSPVAAATGSPGTTATSTPPSSASPTAASTTSSAAGGRTARRARDASRSPASYATAH
jgi:hypothetical protein